MTTYEVHPGCQVGLKCITLFNPLTNLYTVPTVFTITGLRHHYLPLTNPEN